MKAEWVTILKSGRRQRNVVGAVVADKRYPPFVDGKRRAPKPGWYLRWWGFWPGSGHQSTERNYK